jgi:conjugal transfer/entry exclusion protein
MRSLSRRRALLAAVGAAIAGATTTAAPPARADLWGGDLPLLTGILAQAIVEVINLGSMLAQIVEEVNLLKSMMAQLDPSSFGSLLSFVQQSQMAFATLTSGVHAMSYSLQRVDTQFQSLFPASPTTVPLAQHAATYRAWNDEILAASQVASRQQTVLEHLDDAAAKASDLVQQSQNAGAELQQLQLIVQMLGIMDAQLVTLNQSFATTSRVLSDMAATSASSADLSQSKRDNSLSGYTNRGPSVSVPTRLP